MSSKVRPVLKNLINSNTSLIEKFQNEVLRPIIKMQNNLLVTFFKNYIKNMETGGWSTQCVLLSAEFGILTVWLA